MPVNSLAIIRFQKAIKDKNINNANSALSSLNIKPLTVAASPQFRKNLKTQFQSYALDFNEYLKLSHRSLIIAELKKTNPNQKSLMSLAEPLTNLEDLLGDEYFEKYQEFHKKKLISGLHNNNIASVETSMKALNISPLSINSSDQSKKDILERLDEVVKNQVYVNHYQDMVKQKDPTNTWKSELEKQISLLREDAIQQLTEADRKLNFLNLEQGQSGETIINMCKAHLPSEQNSPQFKKAFSQLKLCDQLKGCIESPDNEKNFNDAKQAVRHLMLTTQPQSPLGKLIYAIKRILGSGEAQMQMQMKKNLQDISETVDNLYKPS